MLLLIYIIGCFNQYYVNSLYTAYYNKYHNALWIFIHKIEALNLQIYIFKYCWFVKKDDGFGFTNIHL